MKIIPDPIPRRHYDFTLTMINIVFLLLLFFLTTGSLTNRNEAQSAVPETLDLPLERLPRPLLLVQSDGKLFLDGRVLVEGELADAARSALDATGRRDAALNVLAQRDMPAVDFVALTEGLRASGLALNIVTARHPTGASAP